MMKRLAVITLTLQLCGCASGATFVTRDLGRGRVQLHGAYMPAYASARELIAEFCDGFATVREERASVSFRCSNAPQQLAGIARGR